MSHTEVPSFKDTPNAISAVNDDRRYYQHPLYYADNEDVRPSLTIGSKDDDRRYYQHPLYYADTEDDRPSPTLGSKDDDRRYYQHPLYYADNEDVRPSSTIESEYFIDSLDFGPIPQDSDYESKSVAGRSEGSTGSKDSGYESARPVRALVHRSPQPRSADVSFYYHPAGLRRLQESSDIDLIGTPGPLQEHRERSAASSVRAVYEKETKKTNISGFLCCLHMGCDYQTKRQYDLDRHQKTHFPSGPGEKFDCPARGCGRTGEHGFKRKDHLREHLRKVHAKDIPKQSTSRREPPLHIRNDNDDLEAPSELKAQAETDNKMTPPSPMPPMEPVIYSNRILTPIGWPKSQTIMPLTFQSTTIKPSNSQKLTIKSPKTPTIGSPGHREPLPLLSSQSPYLAEINLGTASGIKKSISHDMGKDDKASPSSTSLESVRDVQIAPEPKITHGESISQSVKLGYGHNGLNPKEIERRPSTVSADVERSKLTITGERGVQDTVEPGKIIPGPDNEARANILDHSVHTMPLTLIDTDDGLQSSLSDDGYELLHDGDDFNLVYEELCRNLSPVEHLANATIIEDGAETGFSGEPIEPAGDISHHQKPVELSKAVMDSDEPSIGNDIISMEQRMTSHVHPVKSPENITMVEDAAQMNTRRNLVEAVDDRSSHMAHDTQASTQLTHMAPQYDAYVMTLLSLRIELRIWHGRHAPSPTIHISTGGEELLEGGKQRIRWTCCCGRRLYDDFEELRPGALEELEQMLNEQNKVCSPESKGSGQKSSSSIRTLWNAAGGIIASLTGSRPFRNNNLPTLPLHQHHAAGQERSSPSSATSETLFLLMCIPYRKHGTRLVHMDLAELVSDETLFKKLRREYQSIRGRWASYFSLWKMAELQFVKFGLHKHQLIDIKKKNDLPPVSLKNEYRYQPIPAETIPPIGKNHLMHLYEHPDHADDVPFCLERIPKKVREQLTLSPHHAPGLPGWGVYFAEGFDWPKFWVFGSVILSLSVLFGVCWSTLRQDIQGGFGVTACMMVAVTFTTGVVQAAVEQR